MPTSTASRMLRDKRTGALYVRPQADWDNEMDAELCPYCMVPVGQPIYNAHVGTCGEFFDRY